MPDVQLRGQQRSNAVVDGGFPLNREDDGADPKETRGSELTYDDYSRLLDDLKAAGIRKVNITGGEPLIKKDALQIVRHAKRNGFWVSMISNGTVMTDEVCETLVGSGMDSITISRTSRSSRIGRRGTAASTPRSGSAAPCPP
jgi:MoaA/NifB/PqqE/SkfB family radical SAM enzyme